ncbi:hypothetical protein ACEPAH_9226 [Sanghuangporus vaninii]
MTNSTALSVLILVCVLLGICSFFRRRATSSTLPPGPKGYWLIGNVDEFFSGYQWKRFSDLSKTFGEILYMSIFGRPVVILNRFEDARQLMDKHGSACSDRPRMVYLVDMLRIRSATFMPYGDDWRAHRRLMQQYLNTRAIASFRKAQSRSVHHLLNDILSEPDAFWDHIKRSVASAILFSTYGYDVKRKDDPLIALIAKSDGAFVRLGPPGFTPVDFFPFRAPFFLPFRRKVLLTGLAAPVRHILPSISGAPFRTFLAEAQAALHEMCTWPYEIVREQKASDSLVPSMLSRMLDNAEEQGICSEYHYENIKDVCGSMYRAGVGTTSSVLFIFIVAMILHPHVAFKAQKELDAVLNGDRLPTFEDQDSLPFITCILKETLRWAPPFPLGIAHRTTEEVELTGMRIPKCSSVVPNIWQMMHDERNYAEPEIFDPDRFMGSNHDTSPVLDPTMVVFGFGRRICPGRHFAEAFLWIAMASILSVFDVLPIQDEHGKDILPKVDFRIRLNSWSLKEFPGRFVVRSKRSKVLIKSSKEIL